MEGCTCTSFRNQDRTRGDTSPRQEEWEGTVMAGRDLADVRMQTVLVVAVGVLLSAGVVNVLIAVVESVLWPVIAGVGWVVVATGVVIEAEAATASSSGSVADARQAASSRASGGADALR